MKRREYLVSTGVLTSAIAIAGCSGDDDDDSAPEVTDSDEQDEDGDPDEEDANIVLPPNSRFLFQGGELNDHNFAERTFTEEQVGTDVSEFNLANADTSNVTDMGGMFRVANSFNQDISEWCVKDTTKKPEDFDTDAGFEGDDAKQPNWGESC